MDLVSKDLDIVKAIVKFVATNCECDFTTDRLTDRVFLCHSSSPQSITYQTQLHGTLQAPVAELIAMLQEWSSSGGTIPVQLLPLILNGACVSSTSYTVECEATEPTQMEDKTSTGIQSSTEDQFSTGVQSSTEVLSSTGVQSVSVIAAVVVVLVAVIVLVTIIITIRVQRSKLKLKKESK